MSVAIRRCSSELRDGRSTNGIVIEIELFGCLIELCLTR